MSNATLTRDPLPPVYDDRRGHVVIAGVVAAAWSIALTWAVVVGLAIIGWSTAGSTASAATASRLASQLWLLVHFVHLQIVGTAGMVSLVPLGLSVGVGAVVYRAGIVATRSYGARTLADCGRVAAAVAVPYGLASIAIASASRTADVVASRWEAACVPAALVGAVCFVAAVRHAGLADRAAAAVPRQVRAVARGALRLAVWWLIASTVLLVVAAVLAAARVQDVVGALRPGGVGTALIALASLLFVPNGAIWAGGYALGGGVSVGPVAVSPFAVTGGALPALPPLAVLPQSAPAAGLQVLVALLPFVALYAGWRMERAASTATESWWLPYARAIGLTAAVAAVVAGLSAASAGKLGTIALGPHPARDAGLAAAGASVATFLVATLRTWRRFDPWVGAALVAVHRRTSAALAAARRILPL